MGGIYALERIANDSPEDRTTIAEVLTAFVRGHAPWPPRPDDQSPADATIERVPELQVRAPDVQAALTVLARRQPPPRFNEPLDLHATDLRKADLLVGAELQGARLHDANLRGARLRLAYLQGADPFGAHLQGADLQNAHLQSADLLDAELQGANLGTANLQGARLRRAKLQGANLVGAQLQEANLIDAQLQEAILLRGPRATSLILGVAMRRRGGRCSSTPHASRGGAAAPRPGPGRRS